MSNEEKKNLRVPSSEKPPSEPHSAKKDLEKIWTSRPSAEQSNQLNVTRDLSENLAPADDRFTVGKNIGRYEIIRKLGVGGMGEVYLAKDKKLGRQVAVKVLNEAFGRHKTNLDRFIREAKAASSLNHPNILIIHEIDESDGTQYIVSEFIEGATLRDLIDSSTLDLSEILNTAIQIASALSAAHDAHIVHRDIKPDNIIVRPDGYAKILDFGLAKLVQKETGALDVEGLAEQTARGVIMGTINYMSPEQAKGEKIDERTDIFSLGIVLYEMISGRTPFAGNSLTESFANLINREPIPLSRFASDTPNEIERIVSKMIRKHRDERYQTIRGLLADLSTFKKEIELTDSAESITSNADGGEHTKILPAQEIDRKSQNENSIAILPFINLSPDAENEYFCDGLAEELSNALSKISDLKVAARSSAFSFKGKNVDVSEIAKVLRVNKIIEGSVRRSGQQMRIAVQLINAEDGYQLWSERYDREIEDIFAIQDEITLAIIDALKVKLLKSDKSALLERYTPDIKAYEYLLRGNYYFEKRTLGLTPEIEIAIEMFKSAIEVDPNYALAHARLAFAYGWKAIYNDAGNPVWIILCRESLGKAESLDHDLPQNFEVRNQIAWSKYGNFDIAKGVDEIRAARKIHPRAGHGEMLVLAFHAGMKEVAVRELQLAKELDPTSDFLRLCSVGAYSLLGPYEEAIEIGRSFGCDALGFTHALIRLGLFDEAEIALEKALAKAPNNPNRKGEKVIFLAAQGRFDEAEAMIPGIVEQITVSQMYHHVTYDFACAYALNGKVDEAVKWLYETLETGMPIYPLFKTDPFLDAIREHPKFIEFIKKAQMKWEDLKRNFD